MLAGTAASLYGFSSDAAKDQEPRTERVQRLTEKGGGSRPGKDSCHSMDTDRHDSEYVESKSSEFNNTNDGNEIALNVITDDYKYDVISVILRTRRIVSVCVEQQPVDLIWRHLPKLAYRFPTANNTKDNNGEMNNIVSKPQFEE